MNQPRAFKRSADFQSALSQIFNLRHVNRAKSFGNSNADGA